MKNTLGLRGKSVLALFGTTILVLLIAGIAGVQAVDSMRTYLGTAFTVNFTLLNRERILAPVSRELALSRRLAGAQVMRMWLLDESNGAKKTMAMQEAEGYRADFSDKSYFLISAQSGNYYFNDTKGAFSAAPRYQLKADNPDNAWFFTTMAGRTPFNINVNRDVVLDETKVWFNVTMMDGERRIGIAGTGLDLSTFLRDFTGTMQPGVTPMVVNEFGAIQAHPDRKLIALNSATKEAGKEQSLFGLLQNPEDAGAARAAMAAAVSKPGSAETFFAKMQGKRQLMAVSYLPELKWHVMTAVDLSAARVIDLGLLTRIAITAAALLALAAFGFVFAVNRVVLKPLRQLQQSAQKIAAGNYTVALPASRNDEIGDLTVAFASMAEKVRRHTEELEETVRERTSELVLANRDMASAHKKISDSISYASLIQRAILPDRQLSSALGDNHFVLWQPRDVVGGDFYVYREVEGGCLLGVADCAGHGVPGAFMTMLARAAIGQAIDEAGAADPAGILQRTDQAIRTMLHTDTRQRDIATNMDLGLVYIDFTARRVTFAGAKIALYWCDGVEVGSIRGSRRAAGDRHPGVYVNETTGLDATRTFYLTTDGFLDQAGGEKGYGFGNARFAEMLRKHANRPLAEQSAAFASTMTAYQGDHPQRDDITILCFRFG
jgi:sigma-B regulation protein RsbU (phosphoserine phosphatase)